MFFNTVCICVACSKSVIRVFIVPYDYDRVLRCVSGARATAVTLRLERTCRFCTSAVFVILFYFIFVCVFIHIVVGFSIYFIFYFWSILSSL